MKHLLEFTDTKKEEILEIIKIATRFKKRGYPATSLKGKIVALIFEKPSTRTRVSFTSAIHKLGGDAIFLSSGELQLARGEPIKDTAMVLSRYVDAIVARVISHSTITELANHSSVPVINALSDKHHPCQALADLMTIFEYSVGKKHVKVAYVGDGNNVCTSLVQICSLVGVDISVASPIGYQVNEAIKAQAYKWAEESGANVVFTDDPEEAVRDADFIYTDVFVSMGQEQERETRTKVFIPKYQVNERLMSLAKKDAKFMHCMPMRVGEEVEESVAYGPSSIIIDQAENRMHTSAALLYKLLAK
ncbi:MAG: ornithine carbamoyltransferase [Nitrososphaerota archaeon]